MSRLSETIGQRLKAARKAANYKSARKFALAHNIPASTYSQHETGKRSLSVEILLHYSTLLSVNAGWLLTGEGDPYSVSNPAKEAILLQMFKNLKYQPNRADISFPPIDGTIALINMSLFAQVLGDIMLVCADKALDITCQELLAFCIDVYNHLINSNDEKHRQAMIKLAISLLSRGARQFSGMDET